MQLLVQVQWSSLRPIQLPLMCVELATSPSGVSVMVGILWIIGNEAGTPNPTNIPGHTALPPHYYTSLLETYQCAPALVNGPTLNSNGYEPKIERKLKTSAVVHISESVEGYRLGRSPPTWSCTCSLC